MKWPSSLGRTCISPRGTCARRSLCHYLPVWSFKLPSFKPLILSSLFSFLQSLSNFPKLISFIVSPVYFACSSKCQFPLRIHPMYRFTASRQHHSVVHFLLTIPMTDHCFIYLYRASRCSLVVCFIKYKSFLLTANILLRSQVLAHYRVVLLIWWWKGKLKLLLIILLAVNLPKVSWLSASNAFFDGWLGRISGR